MIRTLMILAVYFLGAMANAAACEFSAFTALKRAIPEHDERLDIASKSLYNGQFVKWHVYTYRKHVVALEREYFTDEGSITFRFLRTLTDDLLVIASSSSPDE